jgi:uncharacterized membrane protein YoaK (UPF0700 family)
MLNHTGQKRRYKHNVQLAAVLSLVAGLVNIGGLLSLNVFTTNITGHFASFADEIVNGTYVLAGGFLVFLLSFLFGSFTSAISLELIGPKKPVLAHILPLLIEVVMLLAVGYRWVPWGRPNQMLMALMLLYAMGIQNALVTKVSNAVVRTTHFTGIFTDLGIDLAHMLTQNKRMNLKIVKLNIFLRVTIILFFFLGCVVGGFIYQAVGHGVFILTALILIIVIVIEQVSARFFFKKIA